MKKNLLLPSRSWLSFAPGVGLACVLQACGGGGSGVGASNAPQLASGVVTGFGSVFVDGVELEDAQAAVVTENADGSFSNSLVQMGQRVRVEHNGQGAASKVTVDASVIGTVSAISGNTLTVAGQMITVITDSTTAPLTVWGGGYSGLSDVQASDLVEVHGTPVYDSVLRAYSVTASRIQKATSAGRVQVAGSISALNTTDKTFAINNLTVHYATATLRPSGAVLSDGTVVTAYGPLAALSGNTLTASHLKLNRVQDSSVAASTAQFGGQVSKFNSTAKTFEVQGVQVTMSNTTTIQPAGRTVSDGAYISVKGTLGADGSLTATSIQVREQNTQSDLATVKLFGVISDYLDTTSFVVRGIPVDASGITLSTACPGVTQLADGQAVQITAQQQANTPVVYATALSCKPPAGVVIRPLDGVASAVDLPAHSFTVSSNSATQTVQWTDKTTFKGVTAATLNQASVRVEGYLSGSTWVARSIVNTAPGANAEVALDDVPFRLKGAGNSEASSAWQSYRSQHHH